MIPKKLEPVESLWQKELSAVVTDPIRLLQLLQIDPYELGENFAARKLFPMRVPHPYVERMRKGDINDPLLRQVLPLHLEFGEAEGFTADPLLEQSSDVKGLIHKYQSRVLLVVRGGCAINCRYCFRRHFPYQDNQVNREGWNRALEYIKADSNISEVIFSGGDPLMAKDSFLGWLAGEIESIPHIRHLRIHTRFPVVIPQRINSEFLAWFCQSRLNPIMVVHINHANEVDDLLKKSLLMLKQNGVTLLNQSVLLKGVNDSVEAQIRLNEAVFDAGVLPYYLHMLDKVAGASHFDVNDERARDIQQEVIKRMPGFLVPKLVREIGGQPGKTPVDLRLHP